jgi:hypothetical protein
MISSRKHGVLEEQKKLHNEELHNLYSYTDISLT